MKAFLRGCLEGLKIVGIIAMSVLWVYLCALIGDISPILGGLYIVVIIVLGCGFIGWFVNP